MAKRTMIATLTKVTASDGLVLHYTFPRGTGRQRSAVEFLRVEDVPAFEGESAQFELERQPAQSGHPWPFWRALRRV